MTTYFVAGTVLIVIGGILWLLAGSRSGNAPTTAIATTTLTTTLATGGIDTVNGTTIGVLGLVEDSRCPVDVQCIQAGTVRVLVRLNGAETTLKLSEARRLATTTVTLISVEPTERRAGETYAPDRYRFSFAVAP